MMQRLLLLERCIDLISAQFLTSDMKKRNERDFTIDGVIAGLHKLAGNKGFVINHDYKDGMISKIGLIIIIKAGRMDYIDFTISDRSFSLIHSENTRGRVENFEKAETATRIGINSRGFLINYLKTKLPWPKERDLQFIDEAFAVLKTD